MSDDPVTFAAPGRYNREIRRPQVEAKRGGLIARGFDERRGHFDSVYQRFDRLETESRMRVARRSRKAHE